jgi:hypothetical protein
MIPITNNEGAANAKYEIELALLGGTSWQLAAGETPLATLERDGYELSVRWGKLIFAWWSEERSQSWNVVAYEIDEAELRLRAVRGLGREMALLTLRDLTRLNLRRRPQDLTAAERRGGYAGMMADLLTHQAGGARVLRASARGDRSRSLPGRYARLALELGTELALAVGVNESEGQAEIDGILAAGLTWLAGFNERRPEARRARQLWLCVPRGRSQTVIERLTLIDTAHLGARVECFEVDEARQEVAAVRPATQDELLNTHPRELGWPRETAPPGYWRERIRNLAPDLIEVREQVGCDAESYLIHGLEFARASGRERARVSFGIVKWSPDDRLTERQRPALRRGPSESWPRVALTEATFGALESLVREIVAYRRAETPDRRHPFYRLRAEGWLEALLRANIRALDATLEERFVYSQIPTWRADERAVIDLLAVNQQGRLVVIELKAAEDPHLPLQGLDYWLRVEQARGRGEFVRRGLFPGLRLAPEPPLLYLVAPRLRFHRTFSTLARCLAPPVEAYRLGLNANWRSGVRLHTRERVN